MLIFDSLSESTVGFKIGASCFFSLDQGLLEREIGQNEHYGAQQELSDAVGITRLAPRTVP